ncbi:hypothetical protein [Niveibacterium sp. SC-1]|uniref:hypothetical protein n=1 Tax=Niveibacterium sp. SC-1 TaxID=3135646 RepID=UPI00311D5575
MSERWNQLWATFSVRDHCRPGAYVAEALLYDHLLIPVVPNSRRDGLSVGQEHAEWQRWEQKGWQPARLNQMVAILGERATAVPWTEELQGQWRQEMTPPSTAEMVSEISQARRDGFVRTGTVLQRFAPQMARTIVAVSQYHTLEELKQAVPVKPRPTQPPDVVEGQSLLAVLGHELLVPEDPDKDDFELLSQAVDVGSDSKYREKRKQLYMWQQEFVSSENLTDTASIVAAVEQMRDLVSDLNAASGKLKIWKGLKSVFSFLKVGSSVVAFVEPAGAKVAGAAASVGDFVLDRFAPLASQDAALPVASLLLEAQKGLGLTTSGDRRR